MLNFWHPSNNRQCLISSQLITSGDFNCSTARSTFPHSCRPLPFPAVPWIPLVKMSPSSSGFPGCRPSVLVAQLRHWLSPISPTLQMWQENLEFIMFHQIQVSRNLLQRKHLCSVVLWHPTHWPLGNLLSSSEGATVFSGGRKGIWNKVWNWQSFWNLLKVDMDKQRTKW